MFSSLKHPARRKILRMLSERTMTFSQILEALSIPSSHLTYHIESLGDLVVKNKDGKYGLSSFGKATISIMKGAEEVPETNGKHFSAIPMKWKSLYAILLIAIVLLAGLTFVQYSSFNQLSSDYTTLKNDFETQSRQLQAWSTAADKAMTIIRNVAQIDASKYQATLLSDTVEGRADMGGIIEEVMKYSLINNQSRIELTLRFRDNHFSLLQVNQLEGFPRYPLLYTHSQSKDILEASRGIVERYRLYMNDSYLDEASALLALVNQTDTEQTLGNTKLKVTAFGDYAEVLLLYTANGTDFSAKSIHLVFENNILTDFSDDWFLFKIGSSQISVTDEQAVMIAKNAAKNYSWTANGTIVSNFEIVDNPVSVEFYPHTRTESLTLIPYWYVTLYLDKTYAGGVTVIAVGIWADTGQVANIQALGDRATA